MRNVSASNLADYARWSVKAVIKTHNPLLPLSLPRKWRLVFAATGADASMDGERTIFQYNGKEAYLDGQGAAAYVAAVMLTNDAYPKLDATDMDVVDVGANIGGTAIMFLLNGAKRVIAIEPSITAFTQMRNNLEINELDKKAVLLNAAVGIGTTTTIDGSNANSDNEAGKGQDVVKVLNINDLVKEYNIQDGILKVNIEGGEYDLFKSATDETLNRFKVIVFQYHNGNLEEITSRLEKIGFHWAIYQQDSDKIGRIKARKI